MNAKRKIIIDCDPGIDDALALMLALCSPEVEILGITVVCGNVPTEKGAENALKVLQWMDRLDIPVYLGEERPLVRNYVDAMDTHGEDGLGESHYPYVTTVRPRAGAVKFLADSLLTAAASKEKLSIIALGPLTNLARLVQQSPESLDGLDQLVSMGGSYKSHGNCSPVAEYNYWCDPHGAKVVYNAFYTLPQLSGKEIHMIGLDVTRQIVLTPNLLEYMCRLNPERGEIIRRITGFYMDFHWKYEGIIGCVINDPLAAAYLLDPDLCGGIDRYVAVETEGLCRGQTVVDSMDFWKKSPNSRVLTSVNVEEFMYLFFTRLLKKEDGSGWKKEELTCLEQLMEAAPQKMIFKEGGEMG